MARMTGSGPTPDWQALLPVARELERWANVPERHIEDEAELAATLRQLHGCTVTISPRGRQATLRLAGIEVTSQDGLAGACREWSARVQAEALKATLRPK